MKNRIFKKESDIGENFLYVFPAESISKKYNAFGWYKKNESFDSENYDEDDEYTWEYIPYGDDYIDSPHVFTEDGEPDELEHEYEFYGYFDGSNWKEAILTNEFEYCEFEEVTDQYVDGYFDNLTFAAASPDKRGTNKEFYYDKKGAEFFIKHKSRWQGTWSEPYELVSEGEWLFAALPYWTPGEEDEVQMVKWMTTSVAIVDYNYSPDCLPFTNSGFDVVDFEIAECIESADKSRTAGIDTYRLQDGRKFTRHWSRCQGDVDRFYWV